MKRTIVLSIVLIFALLVGCMPAPTVAPADTAVPATAVPPTKVPPTIAPTATTAPTSTPTPVPPTKTFTPVPPTATVTPVPDLAAVLTNAGYTSTTALLPKGLKIGDMFQVTSGDSYKKGSDQFVHIITFPLPTALEMGGFNLELQNPNFILLAVVTALNGVGIDAKADLAGTQIADLSKGVSFNTTVSGTKQKVDVLLFRRGSTGAVVVVVRPDGANAAVDINLVAQKLDAKIAAGK